MKVSLAIVLSIIVVIVVIHQILGKYHRLAGAAPNELVGVDVHLLGLHLLLSPVLWIALILIWGGYFWLR